MLIRRIAQRTLNNLEVKAVEMLVGDEPYLDVIVEDRGGTTTVILRDRAGNVLDIVLTDVTPPPADKAETVTKDPIKKMAKTVAKEKARVEDTGK